MFANRKQVAIDTNEHKLTERVSEMYKMVEDTAVRWQQSCQTTAGHLYVFKDYLETRAEDLSEAASVRNLLMAALVRFPQMTNFPIARFEVFCTRF